MNSVKSSVKSSAERCQPLNRDSGVLGLYYHLNLTMAGLEIYALSLPLISPVMERFFPGIWQCAYLRITGVPCPLCGMTRDFGGFYAGSLKSNNHASVVLLAFIVGTLFYRAWAARYLRRVSAPAQRLLFGTDVLLHMGLLALLVCATLGELFSQ